MGNRRSIIGRFPQQSTRTPKTRPKEQTPPRASGPLMAHDAKTPADLLDRIDTPS
jgi:hypothetical protein